MYAGIKVQVNDKQDESSVNLSEALTGIQKQPLANWTSKDFKRAYDDIYVVSKHCYENPCADDTLIQMLLLAVKLDEKDPNIQLGFEYLSAHYNKNPKKFEELFKRNSLLKEKKQEILSSLQYFQKQK